MSRQVVYVIKETDLFKSLFPLLKTLSSGILERDHWKQFWTLLKADRALSAEGIRLGDMLTLGRALLEKQAGVQELLSRAQGEATLREALQELAIWW
jgi:dynein heavy chain 2, cytosolic